MEHVFGCSCCSCDTDGFIIKIFLPELTQSSSYVSVKGKEYTPPCFESFQILEVGTMMRFLRAVLCGRVSCSMPNCCSRAEYCLTRSVSLKTGATSLSILDSSMYVSNSARAALLLRMSVLLFLPFRDCSAAALL